MPSAPAASRCSSCAARAGLRATANHRFLSVEGWRRLDELTPGTHIALPRSLPSPSKRTMSDDELGPARASDRRWLHAAAACDSVHDARARAGRDRCPAHHSVFGDAVRPRIKAERAWHQVYLSATARLTHGRRNPVAAWLDELGAFRAPFARETRALGRVPSARGGDRGLPPPSVVDRRMPVVDEQALAHLLRHQQPGARTRRAGSAAAPLASARPCVWSLRRLVDLSITWTSPGRPTRGVHSSRLGGRRPARAPGARARWTGWA